MIVVVTQAQSAKQTPDAQSGTPSATTAPPTVRAIAAAT